MALQDSYNTGDDSEVKSDTSNWYGQTFTAGGAYDISSVKLKMFQGTVQGVVTVSLYATAAGKPTGAALAQGTFDTNDIAAATPGAFYEITFASPYSLSGSTQYAIVVEPDSTIEVYLRRDTSSPTYADGTGLFSGTDGASWTILSTQDFMFETYSSDEDGNAIMFGAEF